MVRWLTVLHHEQGGNPVCGSSACNRAISYSWASQKSDLVSSRGDWADYTVLSASLTPLKWCVCFRFRSNSHVSCNCQPNCPTSIPKHRDDAGDCPKQVKGSHRESAQLKQSRLRRRERRVERMLPCGRVNCLDSQQRAFSCRFVLVISQKCVISNATRPHCSLPVQVWACNPPYPASHLWQGQLTSFFTENRFVPCRRGTDTKYWLWSCNAQCGRFDWKGTRAKREWRHASREGLCLPSISCSQYSS